MKKFTLILLVFVSAAYSQIEPVDKDGLAIGGYDVVAYFSGKATRGTSKFSVKHNERKYHFSSKENKDAFAKSPVQYLPQFDGYCAWGVGAKKSKFPINPETFDIIDGKLYLFFNGPFKKGTLNTLTPWNTETSKLLKDSHLNWKKM